MLPPVDCLVQVGCSSSPPTSGKATRSSVTRWTGWPATWTIYEGSFLGSRIEGCTSDSKKENLTFTGQDSPMSHLLLNVMGAFAQFERDLIRERQREGITSPSCGKVRIRNGSIR